MEWNLSENNNIMKKTIYSTLNFYNTSSIGAQKHLNF